MNRSRRVAVLLTGAALAATIAAAAVLGERTDSSPIDVRNPYFAGYYTPTDTLDLGYRSLAAGRYNLAFSMTVRSTAESPGVALNCNFADPNGVVGYLAGSVRTVLADGEAISIVFDGDFEIPEVTVALRCSPTSAGHLEAQFTDVTLTATPLPS